MFLQNGLYDSFGIYMHWTTSCVPCRVALNIPTISCYMVKWPCNHAHSSVIFLVCNGTLVYAWSLVNLIAVSRAWCAYGRAGPVVLFGKGLFSLGGIAVAGQRPNIWGLVLPRSELWLAERLLKRWPWRLWMNIHSRGWFKPHIFWPLSYSIYNCLCKSYKLSLKRYIFKKIYFWKDLLWTLYENDWTTWLKWVNNKAFYWQ